MPDWSSIWPRIASVDSYGGVTGNDLGTTFALLRPKDMPCVAPAHAPSACTRRRLGNRPGIRYLVTVTSMAIMSDHIDCGVVKTRRPRTWSPSSSTGPASSSSRPSPASWTRRRGERPAA